MPETLQKLRIFLASPSDVADERAKVETVVTNLRRTANHNGVALEVCDWHQVVPEMGRPQQTIFDQLKPTSWDVFIGILWHRFGTPSGKGSQSGTEEEFHAAYDLWRKFGKPRIMMYQCQRPLPFDHDPDQFKRVKEFFAEFKAVKGDHPGLYQSFDTTDEFEKLLLDHLQKLLIEYREERKHPRAQKRPTPTPPRHSKPPRPSTEMLATGTIFINSDDSKFTTHFDRFLQRAKHMVMIGTGLNIISQTVSRHELLVKRAQEDAYIEIYAANPFSPNVQTRLIEEEIADPLPRIRKRGLVEWLERLLEARDELNDKSRLVLRLFPFYPTYALFIFDERDYFFYPYGYAQLGNLSPVLHFSKGNKAHDAMTGFLQRQYAQVKERSAEADLIFKLYHHEEVKPEQLIAFAVYVVPPRGSALYEFGSDVLGYDVRTGQDRPSTQRQDAIGAAADFGFHLTVADALYSANAKDLDLISREVEFVAQGFQPFRLDFNLEKDFPNAQGIALKCTDNSGTLEALHHEMVARVYRKAVASNYSLRIAPADRDQDGQRADLMIEHYYAPYILQRFMPHFSLLSNVPAQEKDQIYQDVKKLFEERAVKTSIEIESIAVMHRPNPDGRWQIRKHVRKQSEKELCEYKLGGKKS